MGCNKDEGQRREKLVDSLHRKRGRLDRLWRARLKARVKTRTVWRDPWRIGRVPPCRREEGEVRGHVSRISPLPPLPVQYLAVSTSWSSRPWSDFLTLWERYNKQSRPGGCVKDGRLTCSLISRRVKGK